MNPNAYRPSNILHVDLATPDDVKYWTLALNCTADELTDAMTHVGASRGKLQRYLKDRRTVPFSVTDSQVDS